jgi:hypothetical protein
VDRRLLFECAVTHYAAVNATAEQLDELERLTRDMAASTDWSYYHQDGRAVPPAGGTASGPGTAVEVYHETLAELYAYFIPYPIELLHKSNCDHVELVAALRAGDGDTAVEISRKHVDILHRTCSWAWPTAPPLRADPAGLRGLRPKRNQPAGPLPGGAEGPPLRPAWSRGRLDAVGKLEAACAGLDCLRHPGRRSEGGRWDAHAADEPQTENVWDPAASPV